MTTKGKDWPAIWIGPILWKDIADKAPLVNRIEDLLNGAIDLSDYGSGLTAIRFVPVVLLPSNQVHEAEITYSGRKKEIFVKLPIDYALAESADEKTFRALLARLFLTSIEEYPKHQVRDFDWRRFKADVERLFAGEGWGQMISQG